MGVQSKKKPVPFLDADQIRAATFVRHVEIHDTLGSTNDRAAELARETDIQLPALVVARHQTAGRGRGSNRWWSVDGALTFSALLEPAAMGIQAANWPQLSLATAVAVCDALRSELDVQDGQPRLGIKWPNDVYLDGRKVAGILIESPGGGAPAKNRLVVGIGININNAGRPVPRNAAYKQTALRDITYRKHNLQLLLIRLLQTMEHRSEQLAINDSQLHTAWQKLDWLIDQQVVILSNVGHEAQGTCLGIEADGALLVKNAIRTERIYSGSVRLR